MMTGTSVPLVSVVIPTFNRRDLIGATIQSVLEQTYESLELLVVDDGSTDGTREFVQDTFGSDSRLRYLSQRNRERAVARNLGIRQSQGDYVAFLDSDDLWLPAKLERQVASLHSTGESDCCYCLFDVMDSESSGLEPSVLPPQGDIFEPLLNTCFIGSMTPLIRRRCFDVVGGFCEDQRLLCFEDWEMWTRLATRFGWTLIPEVLGRYRLHAGNTQHSADCTIDELRFGLMRKYGLSSQQSKQLASYMTARRWHWTAKSYIESPMAALQLLVRIASTAPHQMFRKSFWSLAARSACHLLSLSLPRSLTAFQRQHGASSVVHPAEAKLPVEA